jgi:uncharacterized protein with von Willebrand factor type A (vWA) domain
MIVSAERSDGIRTKIVEFCRFARESGFNAGVKETLDALESARVVGITDRPNFKSALRAVLCSSKDEWDRFGDIFEQFWSGSPDGTGSRLQRKSSVESADAGSLDGKQGSEHISIYCGEATDRPGIEDGKSVTGASAHERMRKTDFSKVPQNDLQTLERLSQRLLGQMCFRLSRRLRIKSQGRVDLRRTIRTSITRGGDPVDLRFKGRTTQQPRLVTFIDVSGSMELYSLFLLRFAFALHKHFRHSDTFIFSTRPVDVTEPLEARRLDMALKMLGEMPAGWSGGTRIGESLAELNRMRTARLLSRDTLFIIFSDGLDTGDPRLLAAEMEAIKRRVRKVIWLNPLAGMDNYQPLARGMSAALPYIDIFAAADSLDSLLRLEKILGQRVLR